MSEKPPYYLDDEVKITAATATFVEASYNIADIIQADLVTSESTFMGMDRDTALPLLAGAAAILYILARLAPEPGYYAVVIAIYIAVTVAGVRAKRWVDDKRQMYTYTVVLETTTGTFDAYSSTNRTSVRRIVTAINRAIKASSPHPKIAPSTEFEHRELHSTRRRRKRHHAGSRRMRRDTLLKLTKRH